MPDVEQMLEEMAASYRRKVADDLSLIVQLDIQPGSRAWHVIVEPGRQVTVGRGPHKDAALKLTMTEETLPA